MNPLRLDPSRTATARNRAAASMRSRLLAVGRRAATFIDDEDAFGLKGHQPFVFNEPKQFQFQQDPEKIAAFLAWLQGEIAKGVLESEKPLEDNWLNGFVGSAYKKGVVRAFTEAKPAGLAKPLFYAGKKAQFLESSFAAPEAVSKLKLIYTRSYNQLKGITDDMAGKISRVLADGLAHGTGPLKISRNLLDEVEGISRKRAELLARTEIIYAHAEGQLDSLEALGLDNIRLSVEWMTAGNPCPKCAVYAGQVFTIKEARGLIPLHPNCRCAWSPVFATVDRRKRTDVAGLFEEEV